jgi:hypothetical protein
VNLHAETQADTRRRRITYRLQLTLRFFLCVFGIAFPLLRSLGSVAATHIGELGPSTV